MRRLRAVVQYDGTDFAGFQRQPAKLTVQSVLESALAQVSGHPVQVVGAGRTDAGVHALGQVVHFDIQGSIPADRVTRALRLPDRSSVVVRCVEEVGNAAEGPFRFHARFSASRRTYHYYVARQCPSPPLARFMHWERQLLPDAADRMREGAAVLVGKHDFRAYTSADAGSTGIRRIHEVRIEETDCGLCLRLTANAFLRSMVRLIAGVLLEVGCGKREPEAVRFILESGKRPANVIAAPPHGLFLMRVEYPDGYPGTRVSTAIAAPWGCGGGREGDQDV